MVAPARVLHVWRKIRIVGTAATCPIVGIGPVVVAVFGEAS